MSFWENKILGAFICHYFASVPKTGEEKRSHLRLRGVEVFPDFDAAPPDEKESYLEAAEALELKGFVKIRWEKRGKGERIKTLSCDDFEQLFAEAGKTYPQAVAQTIRTMIRDRAEKLRSVAGYGPPDPEKEVIAFLDYFSDNFGPRETAQGMDQKTVDDFIRLLEVFFDPSQLEKISTRALSILLYRDSKRLEDILGLFSLTISRAKRRDVPVPSLSFLERSYPDTMISGKIMFEYKDNKPPLINAPGLILGLPLESIGEMKNIKTITGQGGSERSVLTIENKETFYALGSPQKYGESKKLSCYDCFLYTGGYPNRAAAALVRLLAVSGFSFYHAGDLDPDGVLILQNILDIAERPVRPVMMNAAVFDRYLPWARSLNKGSLRQLEKIREDTRIIPGLAALISRIEETSCGVEQEIIDYRA
ncbi:hypothetical protein AGMMS50230_03670 [Spirochaetia bacterium]|nr:hypothetical protein AGMMS50230_03670 [Spirochaetia bacterium]